MRWLADQVEEEEGPASRHSHTSRGNGYCRRRVPKSDSDREGGGSPPGGGGKTSRHTYACLGPHRGVRHTPSDRLARTEDPGSWASRAGGGRRAARREAGRRAPAGSLLGVQATGQEGETGRQRPVPGGPPSRSPIRPGSLGLPSTRRCQEPPPPSRPRHLRPGASSRGPARSPAPPWAGASRPAHVSPYPKAPSP